MKTGFKVSHILVKHEYEALDILKKIETGMTFTQAATKFSTCPSARDGGQLGQYKPGRFVEAFEEALEPLELNKISRPVRTRFGYHLILKTI